MHVFTFVYSLAVLSFHGRFTWLNYWFFPPETSYAMAQFLPFITVLLSKPLAILQPMWSIYLAFPSPSICLLLALILCQLQPVWGIKSQGCRGNLYYPYHWIDHSWIVVPQCLIQCTHEKRLTSLTFLPLHLLMFFLFFLDFFSWHFLFPFFSLLFCHCIIILICQVWCYVLQPLMTINGHTFT